MQVAKRLTGPWWAYLLAGIAWVVISRCLLLGHLRLSLGPLVWACAAFAWALAAFACDSRLVWLPPFAKPSR